MYQTLLNRLDTWKWYSFSPGNLNLVPLSSGVYSLGVNSNIIYIGSSSNLRDRLSDHYNSTDYCISRARQFAIEPCTNYLQLERQRLQNYLADHGRLPDCNDMIP
jgi:hypothetical protein